MNTNSNPKLTDNAKNLRKNMTKEERHLWYDFLKKLSITVNRQKVIGKYIVDFYIAHLLEIETVRLCVEEGITPPVWSSANTPGGDEKNAALLKKYRPRVKML